MDAARPLVRLRWRLRGAWLWPSFVVLSIVDAVVVSRLPIAGDSASFVGGWILGAVLSLLAIILLSRPLASVVRRVRPDMPVVVARNYAGALITLAVTLVLLGAGLVHRHTVTSDRAAMQDATARAEAFIGDHAPAAFQNDLNHLSTLPVQPPDVYRVCAANAAQTKFYCVAVTRHLPFGRSVRYAGSESNQLLGQGAG